LPSSPSPSSTRTPRSPSTLVRGPAESHGGRARAEAAGAARHAGVRAAGPCPCCSAVGKPALKCRAHGSLALPAAPRRHPAPVLQEGARLGVEKVHGAQQGARRFHRGGHSGHQGAGGENVFDPQAIGRGAGRGGRWQRRGAWGRGGSGRRPRATRARRTRPLPRRAPGTPAALLGAIPRFRATPSCGTRPGGGRDRAVGPGWGTTSSPSARTGRLLRRVALLLCCIARHRP
jgi:hypothetical protein